jgi:hypothetical protein
MNEYSSLTSSNYKAFTTESYENNFHPSFPKWVTILVIVVGLFGNTLSLIVFISSNMRNTSIFRYLAYLSVVDSLVLILGLGDMILISYTRVVLRNYSIVLCRLHTFLLYTFTHLSSFILASVSIDRAISSNLITLARVYCKPEVTKKVFLVNLSIAILINFHSLFFLGYEKPLLVATLSSTTALPNDILNEIHTNATAAFKFDDEISKDKWPWPWSLNANAKYSSTVIDMNTPELNLAHHSHFSTHRHQSQQFNNLDQNQQRYMHSDSDRQVEFTCASRNGTLYDMFLEPYFEWIDLFFYAIMPFIIMIVCTCLIVRVVFSSNKHVLYRYSITSQSGTGDRARENTHATINQANAELANTTCSAATGAVATTAIVTSASTTTTTTTTANATTSAAIGSKKPSEVGVAPEKCYRRSNQFVNLLKKRASKSRHMTYTLIAINLLFFFLVSPLVIVLALLNGKYNTDKNKLLINIVYVLAYSNHSLNFVFYGLSSPPYRKAVLSLLGVKKRRLIRYN